MAPCPRPLSTTRAPCPASRGNRSSSRSPTARYVFPRTITLTPQVLNKSKHGNEEGAEGKKSTKKRAVEGSDARPSPAAADSEGESDADSTDDNDDGPASPSAASLRTYLQHHSRLLVKSYDALVGIQNALVNLQEGQAAQTAMLGEAGRVYLVSQYLTTKNEVLGPRFPWLMGRRKPDLRRAGTTRLDPDEVPDLYAEIADLAGYKWRCPTEGCDEGFETRKELRGHMK